MDTSILILEWVKTLVWPLTTLVIILIFRSEILSILSRIRKADFPGGISVETFPNEINEARKLSFEVRKEISSDTKKKNVPMIPLTDANAKMINLGLLPSPSGLDISYYRNLADQDPVLALAGLRIELDTMLKNVAKGFDIETNHRDSISVILHKLIEENAITSTQAEFINSILRLANAAVHGVKVTREQVEEILHIATTLRDQYVSWLSWGFENDEDE